MKTIIVNRRALDAMVVSSLTAGRLPAIGERKIGEDSFEIDIEVDVARSLDCMKLVTGQTYSEIIIELVHGREDQ